MEKAIKGLWKPYSNHISGMGTVYIAGRQLDITKPLHSGNIEYSGGYSADKEAVDKMCEDLNGAGKTMANVGSHNE